MAINTAPKKHNSVATIAFTVQHDDPEYVPDAEYLRALLTRIGEVAQLGEWQEACGTDFYDTQLNEIESKQGRGGQGT